MTLACEDINSKTCWGCCCSQCWWWGSRCRFGSWGLAIKNRLWAQGLVAILKLKCRQDFYGEKIFRVGKGPVKLSTLATLVTHWLTHSVTNLPTICDLAMFIFMLFITLSRIMEEAPTSSPAVEMHSTATSPIASTSGWQVFYPDPDDGWMKMTMMMMTMMMMQSVTWFYSQTIIRTFKYSDCKHQWVAGCSQGSWLLWGWWRL